MLIYGRKPFALLLLICLFLCQLNSNDIQFVRIDGQTFEMGDNKKESRFTHDFFVDDFYIADFNVTVAEWKSYCLDTGYDYKWDRYYTVIDKWHTDRLKPPLEFDGYNDS